MLHYISQHLAPLPQAAAERAIIQNVSRRSFLKGTAAGGGLVVAMQLIPFKAAEAFETYDHGGHAMPHGVIMDPHLFVSIAPDGTVDIITIRSEMGTGARTSLPMVIADELEADWSRVTITQAEGDEPKYGNQDTDGSRSMRHHIQVCRQMGASVRHMLRQAAADAWGVDVAEVQAINHEVIHEGSGNRAGYGDMGQAAMALEAPDITTIAYKDESEFRYIGKGEVQIYDLHDITTGSAVYGADVHLDGMKYAVVARPPVVGGTVKSVDDSAALAVPGVEKVVQMEGHTMPAKFLPLGGVAVVANSTYAALKGRDALVIEWEDGPHAQLQHAEAYRSGAARLRSASNRQVRSFATRAMPGSRSSSGAAKALHPGPTTSPTWLHIDRWSRLAALATVRRRQAARSGPAGAKSPYGARLDIADYTGPGRSTDVTVSHVTLLGGGFGRKSKCDFVHRGGLSVAWTDRRPGARAVDPRGRHPATASTTPPRSERIEVSAWTPTTSRSAWRHRSRRRLPFSRPFAPDDSALQHPIELRVWAWRTCPTRSPNVRCRARARPWRTRRIGWFRSVSNIPRAFAIQSGASAELAHELGRDRKGLPARDDRFEPQQASTPQAAGLQRGLSGTTANRYAEFPERHRALCADVVEPGLPRRRAGAKELAGEARAWESRCTAASSPTWRRWCHAKVDGGRNRSHVPDGPSRASTAVSWPIPERVRSPDAGRLPCYGMTAALQ